VLGALVVVMLVLLAAPLNRYFGSRGDVGRAAGQLTHDRAQLGKLKHQKSQWGDPGYIEQQARMRLQYAMPGDTVYVVVDHGAKTEIEKTSGSKVHDKVGGTWNSRLWDSVQQAAGT
jgi:cell division protein FtsB